MPGTHIARLEKGVTCAVLCAALLIAGCGLPEPKSFPPPTKEEAMSAPDAPKLALLVGISEYAKPEVGSTDTGWPALHTEADISKLKELLISRYGFRADDIRVLQNSEATAERIDEAFYSHLVNQAKPGSVIVFHFSGHGQQLPDQGSPREDEEDYLDESLVTFGAYSQSVSVGENYNIRDDLVANWLSDLQAKMVGLDGRVKGSINVFFDSCFSGTATRDSVQWVRGRPWDRVNDGAIPMSNPMHTEAPTPLARTGLPDVTGAYFFISAASDKQAAQEESPDKSSDGLIMGVFTRALVTALERADGNTTYDSLLRQIAGAMEKPGYKPQTPQLYGTGEASVLGGLQPISPASFVAASIVSQTY